MVERLLTTSEKSEIPEEVKEVVERTLAELPGSRQKDLYIALLPEKSNSPICGGIDG